MKVSELEKALRLELEEVRRRHAKYEWSGRQQRYLAGVEAGLTFALELIGAEARKKKEAVGGQYPGSADDGGDPREPGVNALVRDRGEAAPRPLDDPA